MRVLNLIVHKELISSAGVKYDNVLRRIREVEGIGGNNLAYILDDDFNFRIATKLSRDYDAVVLFGGSRMCCLYETFKVLHKSKIPVSYDIEGTC